MRLGVITVVAAIGFLIALAGYETAVRTLLQTTGADRAAASLLIGFVIVLIVVPGGVTGVVWTATGAAGILLAALALPLIVLVSRGAPIPFPVMGDAALWRQALARMAEWHTLPGDQSDAMGFALIGAIAIGVGVMAPLLAPAIAARDAATARTAGLAGIAWTGVFVALLAATMALAAMAFDSRLTGQRPDRLPAFAYQASQKGLVSICGQSVSGPSDALEACRRTPGFRDVLRAEDIVASGAFLTVGLPASRGLSVAFSGLVGSALAAIAMMIAASGFQTVGTAVGHDAFYRIRDSSALTSRRLAVTRFIIVAVVIGACALVMSQSLDPRALIGLAIAFSTAAIAPLIMLSLWPRAGGADATIALLVGLATAETVIVSGGSSPSIERLAAAAVIACVTALLAGIGTSLFREGGPESQGGPFLHGVLHGEQDVLNPDKGA